jgi:hypothetical protein
MTFAPAVSTWVGLPPLSNLPVNTERDGRRHWTKCTQSACVMAVHHWNPAVPVTNAERDALDATPPHQAGTGTTIVERDTTLVSRYGWAGYRASSNDQLYSLLAGGAVGVFAGSGDHPDVTDFQGDHALAIGPAARGAAWVRDPLHTSGHWAPWVSIMAWSWGFDDVAIYPAADPSNLPELTVGIGTIESPPTSEPVSVTAPTYEPVSVTPAPAPRSVSPGGVGASFWIIAALAAVAVAWAMTKPRKVES